jgi:hypothetical protein
MRHLLTGLVCASLCCALLGCESGGNAPAPKGKTETTPPPATSQATETLPGEDEGVSENLVLVSLSVPNMT